MWTWAKKLFYTDSRGSRVNGAMPTIEPDYVVTPFKDRIIADFNYVLAVQMYRTNPVLAGCLNLNAKTISTIPLKLYTYSRGYTAKQMSKKCAFNVRPLSRKSRAFLNGDLTLKPSKSVYNKFIDYGGDFVEVEGRHPILQLLQRGSASTDINYDNGIEQTVARMVELQLTGNYYLQVLNNKMKMPAELWVVPSQWMKIEPFKQGDTLVKQYFWGEDRYNWTQIPTEEIIHARQYNPDDLYYGLGSVESCWADLNWLQSYIEYSIAMFENMGIPGLFAKLTGASKDQLSRFESAYNRKMKGSSNAGKLLAHADDIEFQVPANSAGTVKTVADLGASYLDRITEICFALGVPISKLKSNDSTLASAFITDQAWHRDAISHLCNYDEMALNEGLVSRYEGSEEMILAYDNVIPKDEKDIEERLINLANNGIISKDKVREELGYEEEDAPEEVEITDSSVNKDQSSLPQNGGDGNRAAQGTTENYDENKK